MNWYKINDTGQEVEHFNRLFEKVRIVSLSPTMATPGVNNNNLLEAVKMRHEKITRKHCDGNIIFADAPGMTTEAVHMVLTDQLFIPFFLYISHHNEPGSR
nr:hypothetical protein [Mixta theicola]